MTGGRTFGYRNERHDGHVERVIDPTEAAVVRKIFEMFSHGHGVRSIARRLNAERAPSPRSQQGRPQGWSGSTVRSVLVRSDYTGTIQWNTSRKRDRFGRRKPTPRPQAEWATVEAPDLRIIPPALAAKVAARFATARAAYVRNNDGTLWGRPPAGVAAKYLLTGMAVCGLCGGALNAHSTAHGTGRRFRYRCLTNWQRGSAVCPNTAKIRVEDADRAVLDKIKRDVLNPHAARDAIAEAVRRLTATTAERSADPVSETKELAPLEYRVKQFQGLPVEQLHLHGYIAKDAPAWRSMSPRSGRRQPTGQRSGRSSRAPGSGAACSDQPTALPFGAGTVPIRVTLSILFLCVTFTQSDRPAPRGKLPQPVPPLGYPALLLAQAAYPPDRQLPSSHLMLRHDLKILVV